MVGRTSMRGIHPFLYLALGLLSLVGCQDTPEGNKAKKDIRVASDSTGKALNVEKEEYKKKLEADLDKLDDKLKEYKEKASRAKDDAKVKMDNQIEALQVQRDKTREKLKDLGGDTKEAGAEVKKGLDKATGDLKDAFEKAKKSFE